MNEHASHSNSFIAFTSLPQTSCSLTPETQRPRWMVVDDNAVALEVFCLLLQKLADVEICRFHCAKEAIKAFAITPKRFHYVATDLEMPHMSGIEFCRQLRSLMPALSVLLVTSSGLVTQKEALQLGFCDLIAKPVSAQILQRTLEATGMLNRRNSIMCRAA